MTFFFVVVVYIKLIANELVTKKGGIRTFSSNKRFLFKRRYFLIFLFYS